jgi:hypothetical protein
VSEDWNDLQGTISQGAANLSLDYEVYRDTPLRLYFWRRDQADELHFVYQMPHHWDLGYVRPHLHIVPMAATGGLFAFDAKYVWASVGDVIPPVANWTAVSVSRLLVATDQYKHTIVTLPRIAPPRSAAWSSILLLHMARNTTTDTYEGSKDHGTAASNVGLLSSDVHYRSNCTHGSYKEF